MNYKTILITGGAGFIGSTLSLFLKSRYPHLTVIAFDNLRRRGSELNVPRLQGAGIEFVHGDIRNTQDLSFSSSIDCLIECSAEPSVLAGINSSPSYVLQTNLMGAVNCFELARMHQSDVLFLSTSRVYPIPHLKHLALKETETRFALEKQSIQGGSLKGINEQFPLDNYRSLYGSTKLSAELILQEYIQSYQMKGVINRFGVVAGPWQMGKADQGLVAYWLSRYVFPKRDLSYIGFKGTGKQTRDILHVNDLCLAIDVQLRDITLHNGLIYNIGGGIDSSASLVELTALCEQITGIKVPIKRIRSPRKNDIPVYISDYSLFEAKTGWKPTRSLSQTVEDTFRWMQENKERIQPFFAK